MKFIITFFLWYFIKVWKWHQMSSSQYFWPVHFMQSLSLEFNYGTIRTGIFARRYTVLRTLRILPVGIIFGLKLHFSPSFGTSVEFHVETRRYFKSSFSTSLLLYSKNNSLGSIVTYERLPSKMNWIDPSIIRKTVFHFIPS